jgi:DNA sulfur modification protein DndB
MDIENCIAISGAIVDENEFSGVLPTGLLLRSIVPRDPREAEDPNKLDHYGYLRDIAEIREEVQRSFDNNKEKNVDPYADYLIQTEVEKKDGRVPPIFLWTQDALKTNPEGTKLYIPYSANLVAIDGETQLAARFEAYGKNRAIGDAKCKVVFVHGKPPTFAKQVFFDLNSLGIRPAANFAAAMDQRNPVTSIVRHLEENLPFFTGRVNQRNASLKGSTDLVSFLNLRTFVATVAFGTQGVTFGAKPIPLKEEQVPKVRRTALEFLRKLHERFPNAMQDKDNYLLLSPTILGSIGALVTSLVEISDQPEFDAKLTEVVDKLDDVMWHKANAWLKVAGRPSNKARKDGTFGISMGGAKQSGHAVIAALNDPKSENYRAIRDGKDETPPVDIQFDESVI